MRYFIGNLIRGEAAEFYKATCADLSSRFGIDDVSTIVAPHITVKSPFERPGVEAIDDLVSLLSEAPPIPFTLSGWGHFTTRTIYIDAKEPTTEVKNYIKSVLLQLQSLGLSNREQDDSMHIHMSIARFLKPDQYEQVWNYLQPLPSPVFDINFDNLTIFTKEKKEDKAWKILKTFPLIGKRK
jgi:2'-5' RNA ligase